MHICINLNLKTCVLTGVIVGLSYLLIKEKKKNKEEVAETA